MSELSGVVAFFVLIALLASRIARERRQNSARNDADWVVDEPPRATKACDEASPRSISLAASKHAAGQH
jgi:hypothetical protein